MLRKLMVVGVVLGFVASMAGGASVGAINALDSACKTEAQKATAVCKSKGDNAGTLIGNVVGVLMFIIGAVSAIMIIIGGIKYATSNGDANSIQSAKNTILYAVIGLVVAVAASAIVNFILSRL